MPEALIITSLPRTLDGSQGYGIAAQTRGIDRLLVSKLNALANYDFDKSAEGIEPINFFHVKVDAAHQSYQVLGRISSAPADYTGRANYIAHFFAFTIRELHQAGPVAVLRHLIDNQRFSDKYQGPPQEWEPIGWNLSGLTDIPQGKCPLWEQTFGNAAMGGIMADRLEKREATGFFYRSEQLSSTLWDHLTEANAVLRPGLSRWNATFATASHGWSGDNAVFWKGTLNHTKGERRLRTDPRLAFVDFSDPSKTNAPLTRGEYSHIAQNGLTLKPSPMALVKPIEKEPEDLVLEMNEKVLDYDYDLPPAQSPRPSQSPPVAQVYSPNRPPPTNPQGRTTPPPIRRPEEEEDRGWNNTIVKRNKPKGKINKRAIKAIAIVGILLIIVLSVVCVIKFNLPERFMKFGGDIIVAFKPNRDSKELDKKEDPKAQGDPKPPDPKGAEAKGAEAKNAEAKGAEAKGTNDKSAMAKGAEDKGVDDKKLQDKADKIELKILGLDDNFDACFPDEKKIKTWIKLNIAKQQKFDKQKVFLDFRQLLNSAKQKTCIIQCGHLNDANGMIEHFYNMPCEINSEKGELQKLFDLNKKTEEKFNSKYKESYKTLEDFFKESEGETVIKMYEILSTFLEYKDREFTNNLFFKIEKNELIFNSDNYKNAKDSTCTGVVRKIIKVIISSEKIKDTNQDAILKNMETNFNTLMDAIAKLNPKKGLKK